jgi:hypothetical protein
MEGWLYQARGRQTWTRRWFVLHQTKLYYYESDEAAQRKAPKPKGSVSLPFRCDIVNMEVKRNRGKQSERFGFEIMSREGSIIQLCADNEMERSVWANALRSAIDTVLEERTRTMQEERLQKKDQKERSKQDMAQNCEAFGGGLFGATAGEDGRITIQVNDEAGQPCVEGGMVFATTLENDDLHYDLRTVDNDDGTYTVTYCAVMAGTFELHIILYGYDIYGSPFAVQIEPAAFSRAKCIGDGLTTAYRDDRQHSFQVLSKDVWGNQLRDGGQPFHASIAGPAQLTTFQDNGDGSYSGAYIVKAELNRYLAEGQAPVEISITYGGSTALSRSQLLLTRAAGAEVELQPDEPENVEGSPFRPAVLEPPPSMPPPPERDSAQELLAAMPLPPPPLEAPPPLPPAEIPSALFHAHLGMHPAVQAVAPPPLQEVHTNLTVEEVHRLLQVKTCCLLILPAHAAFSCCLLMLPLCTQYLHLQVKRADIENEYERLSDTRQIGLGNRAGDTNGLVSAAAAAKRVRPTREQEGKEHAEQAALELAAVSSCSPFSLVPSLVPSLPPSTPPSTPPSHGSKGV